MDVPSPCISICKMDAMSGLCRGCKRTSYEITMWPYYSNDEKTKVLEALEQRKNEF